MIQSLMDYSNIPLDIDDDPDHSLVSPLQNLVQKLTAHLSKKNIDLMAESIKECQDQDMLVSVLSYILTSLLTNFGTHSLSCAQLNKDFSNSISRALSLKLDELQTLSHDGTEASEVKSQLLKYVIDVCFDSLRLQLSETTSSLISPQAAKIALQTLSQTFKSHKKVLANLNLTQSVEAVLVNLAHSLEPSKHALLTNFYEIFNITPNFKYLMNDDLPFGKFHLLSVAVSSPLLDQQQKQTVSDYLLDQLQKQVLMDKQPLSVAEHHLTFFSAWLSSITEVIEHRILPQTELIMNRTSKFLPVIAALLSCTSAYRFSSVEILDKWLSLISDDTLFNKGSQSAVESYIKALVRITQNESQLVEHLASFFINKLKEAKRSKQHLSDIEKQLTLHFLSIVLQSNTSPFLFSKDAISAILEHAFSLVAPQDISDLKGPLLSILSKADTKLTADLLTQMALKLKRLNTAFQSLILQHTLGRLQIEDGKLVHSQLYDVVVNTLNGENFKSTQNFSLILSLSAILTSKCQYGDISGVKWLLENGQANAYFLNSGSFLNQQQFVEMREVSKEDRENHLEVLRQLLRLHFNQNISIDISTILLTLSEYLLNPLSTFRQTPLFACFQTLQQFQDAFTLPFFNTLFQKITEVSLRPEPQLALEEHKREQSLSTCKKIVFMIKLLYGEPSSDSFPQRSSKMEGQEFYLLLRIICHPFVSRKWKNLMDIITSLSQILETKADKYNNQEYTLSHYFEKYATHIIQYALVSRSGVLSPNPTLREIGKNMLICLGWQGFLKDFIHKLVVILNHTPLEHAEELKRVVTEEARAIGHYDLMFYSEVTKDLLQIFKSKDEFIAQTEIQTAKKSETEEEKKEEKPVQAAPVKQMSAAEMQAALLKKMAAAKKAGGAPKGGKTPAAKPISKGSGGVKQVTKKEEEVEEVVVDKETRNKQDFQQMISYCEQIQSTKNTHVSAVWDILLTVNRVKEVNLLGYQDLTLLHIIQPAIKLLGFKATRFSTYHFLINLFTENRESPFYGIREPLMIGLLALQEAKITQKTQYEIQKFFDHVRSQADFQDMDAGYLQMILLLANFVLKSLEVNLSVKESALNVALEILETNPRVQNIDLVRLTINMMKSNYVGKNLSHYLAKLIKRLSQEELGVILYRLFEFSPLARTKLLTELLNHNDPLICPVWMSTQMWIMQFDEEFFSLARKVWNKFGLVLRSGLLDLNKERDYWNIYYHMRSDNIAIFDMTVKAVIAAIEIMHGKFGQVIDDLLKFYFSEIVVVRQMNLEALRRTGDDNNFEGIKRFNRIAVPKIILKTSSLVPVQSIQKLLDFFVEVGSNDEDSKVSEQCLAAAEALIHAKGNECASKILQILEKYVDQSESFKPQSIKNAVILIGTVSDYLDKNGQKKLIQTFEKMVQLLKRPVGKGGSELVNHAICRCIPKLSRFFEDRSKQIFNEQFLVIREGKIESETRGSAYACAGIVKSFGLRFFIERDIIKVVQKECMGAKKAEPIRLQAGLELYETLAFALGKSFEPFVKDILPTILVCISDAREGVRARANATNKQILSNLSNYAIKQVVPMFLEGLKTDNWRGKYAAIEALGDMAYCAPKQILGFLPDIVKALREVLTDTHEKVHEASLGAISKIGSVIKCPEVAELLNIIIKALGNSNVYLNECLDALLQTSFVHAIDAPSLSLLVPLVDIGLTMHDNQSKQKSSQLVGHICSLTQDPQDLLPYMKILIPAIKNSLFDSIPEIRASAAKALGRLSKGLGLANSIELLEWLNTNLKRGDLVASERSGAAQGLSEVVSSHGDNFFSNQCKEIIKLARSPEVHLRESYRTVMSYLPTSFANFVNYLSVLLPIMIEGLGDISEEARKVSLRNVKICIQQYGKRASEMLCQPILSMMFDKDSRVRMSSSILMYQLVKEMENDIIKSQPKYINLTMKHQILSAMFIGKFDPIEKLQIQASQIWKSLVDAPVHVLRQIIQTLINMVFDIIQSPYLELQEMGLGCMRGLVEKFGERIVNESLDILEAYLEQTRDASKTTGISRVILNMAEAASHRILYSIKQRLIAISDPFLISDNPQIRELAAKVFLTIFRRVNDPANTQSVIEASFLSKLNALIQNPDAKQQTEYLIGSFTFMLTTSADLKLEDKVIVLCGVPSHRLSNPLTTAQAVLLRAVAPTVAPLVFSKKFYNTLFSALRTELTQDPLDPGNNQPERLDAILKCFAEVAAFIPEGEQDMLNDEITAFHDICLKRNTQGFYVDLIEYYCKKTQSSLERRASLYAQNVLKYMNSENQELVQKVTRCVESLFQKLPKEAQFALVPYIREAIEEVGVERVDDYLSEHLYRRRVSTIKMFESKEGVQTIAGVIQNSIMHGSIKIRIDSAFCFKYLIDFSSSVAIKSEVIKICGALIRVVNDKFPSELKIQIFFALRLMIEKAAVMVKAMVAQLQTTLLRAISDPQATQEVREVVVDNLMILVTLMPKIDPIVKELVSQLEGDKIDGEQKVQVSLALALLLRAKGATIQDQTSKQVYQTLTAIIEDRKRELNDKVILLAAAGIGFLSAYSSDPTQMKDLFNAYDDQHDYRVSIGIKAGVLMNGSPKIPEVQTLIENLRCYLAEVLSCQSGIVEVDGKDISEGRPEEEIFRFDGALDTSVYIMDQLLRRFQPSDSILSRTMFGAINDSKVLRKIAEEEDFMAMSRIYTQMRWVMEHLPLPVFSVDKPKLSEEQKLVLGDCLQFLHKNYLDFESKRDVRLSLLNLLQLTYNNGMDLGVSVGANEVIPITKPFIRDTVCESSQLGAVVPQDLKMAANDIIFG